LQENLDIQDRKYHFTTYRSCFVGSAAVPIIIVLKFAQSETEAIAFGNKLIDEKIIAHIAGERFENKQFFYKFLVDLKDVTNLETLNKATTSASQAAAAPPSQPVNESVEPDNIPRFYRSNSQFQFEKPDEYETGSHLPYVKTVQIGSELLRNAAFNKGLAFTFQERREYNLHGLLPPIYRDLRVQSKQLMANIDRMKDPLDQYVLLMNILATNEKLFYHTLCNNLARLMPIVYTPTVGLACQKFGDIFIRPRGLYITIKDKGRIYQMLKNYPTNDVRAICFTDGERILGLGDLGAQGMAIPIGKLALYTGCGGVRPDQLLPVTIDVGCNNVAVRNSEFYIGLRQGRVRGAEYDELIEEFMRACTYRWGPHVLLQFEDFGNVNAFRLLQKFKNEFCTFNDDIQGTAAVALAGIYSALRIKGCISKLSDHVFVMFGAGSAGVGIANLIVSAICKESGDNCKLPEEARKQIWLVDSRGLVFANRASGGITDTKAPFAHEWSGGEIKDLDAIVRAVKGTALLGVSGQGQTFNEATCKAVLLNNARPIIFPMSNPTHKAECSAEDAYKWTDNQCIFASGSPFPRMTIKRGDDDDAKAAATVEIVPAQANNAYIFPGVALGVIASRATRITDDMFMLAAQTLSSLVTDEMLAKGTVYPPIHHIRAVSFEIAARIAAECYRLGIASEIEPIDIRGLIRRKQYNHSNSTFYSDTVFNNLEQEFMHKPEQRHYEYVIVGGGVAAGYACKEFVDLGITQSKSNSVCLVSAEAVLPYERPALSKGFLLKQPLELPAFNTCAFAKQCNTLQWYTDNQIEVRLGTKVTRIDYSQKRIFLNNGEPITYNKVLLCTGSKANKIQSALSDIYYLRDINDARRLKQVLYDESSKQKECVIVGGGYIGMELASAVVQVAAFKKVTMVFSAKHITILRQTFGAKYHALFVERGVEFVTGSRLQSVEGDADGNVTHVVLKNGQSISAQIVICGVGGKPNSDLFQKTLEMDAQLKGLRVNKCMQSVSNKDVYGCGDIIAFECLFFGGRRMRLEHVRHARASAKFAVRAMCQRLNGNEQSNGYYFLPVFYSAVFAQNWIFYGDFPKVAAADDANGKYAIKIYSKNVSQSGGAGGGGGEKRQFKLCALWVRKENNQVVGIFVDSDDENDRVAAKNAVEMRENIENINSFVSAFGEPCNM